MTDTTIVVTSQHLPASSVQCLDVLSMSWPYLHQYGIGMSRRPCKLSIRTMCHWSVAVATAVVYISFFIST